MPNELRRSRLFRFVVVAIAPFMMTACQSIGEPVRTGQNSYEMLYLGQRLDGPAKAQAFCKKAGFDFANVSFIHNDFDAVIFDDITYRMGFSCFRYG